ncbi:MAG: hypothetical protein HUJ26_02685 [Planctomycetaceae bacterium]|nr:hypothetical protein [Planctomycetaceae bacterium]
MAESLNRSEVESLLTALNPVRRQAVEVSPETPSSKQPSGSGSQLARQVVRFFESIRRQATAVAEQCVSQPVRLKRYMPDRVPLTDLRSRITDESVVVLVETEQSGGDLILVCDREIVGEFIADMLGQSDVVSENQRSALSVLESRIFTRWLRESLVGLLPPSQWKVVAVELVEQLQRLQAFAEQAPWWCERWELILSGKRGGLLIAGQWEFFSSLSTPQAAERPSENQSPEREPLTTGKTDSEVQEVLAVWSECRLESEEPRPLEVGDILWPESEQTVSDSEVILQREGREVARGRVGESQGRKAVEISRIFPKTAPETP